MGHGCWLCIKEELEINIESDKKSKEWYDNFLNEKEKTEYQSVKLLDEFNNPIEVKD